MGSVAIGALAALIGVLSGQGMSAVFRSGQLSKRIALLEESVPELITRNEVQSAFQQVAQIEAQRMAQQTQQQQLTRALLSILMYSLSSFHIFHMLLYSPLHKIPYDSIRFHKTRKVSSSFH